MSWVTHEVLIVGQFLAACAYTAASYRLWRADRGRWALGLLAAGMAFDVASAILGATSDLGDNPQGAPWGHPLFSAAVVLATLGMMGYMVDLALITVKRWRTRAAAFLRYSQLVIWPSWMAGVTLFVMNVFFEWF